MTDEKRFDVVVVGSGFGGSVLTYRLAEKGFRVCLLERGKAYPPNSFPRAPYDMAKNFWDPSEGLFGMFNIWSFRGSGGIVASGLGGGSLIYANILARKDPSWFKYDLPNGGYRDWPVTYDDLDRHYTDVERMMNAQKYPLDHAPYRSTPKTQAMRDAADVLKNNDFRCEWRPMNLAVSFRRKTVASPDEDAENNPPLIGAEIAQEVEHYHELNEKRRMPRTTCRLCGECDIGCNFGSKNTLDFTYITAAVNQAEPAEVRTLSEVKTLEPIDGGYSVTYEHHDPRRSPEERKAKPDLRTISSKLLILAAGTYATPYLFLKNRASFPHLSPQLGKRYSVNGDLLAFISNSKTDQAGARVPRRLDPSFGPVITSAIRFDDELDGNGETGRGFYVEDGGQPSMMSWLAEVSGLPGFVSRSAKFLKLAAKYRLRLSNDADLGAEIAGLIGDAEATMSTIPILTMGRDLASGELKLTDNLLDCTWTIKQSRRYFDRVIEAGEAIAGALNAKYRINPSYKFNFQQVLTAHPLGGCSMADTKEEGVVDANCEVFGYPGLFIADGSVMPAAVGPNPSLTIAAIADRAADYIIFSEKPGIS